MKLSNDKGNGKGDNCNNEYYLTKAKHLRRNIYIWIFTIGEGNGANIKGYKYFAFALLKNARGGVMKTYPYCIEDHF